MRKSIITVVFSVIGICCVVAAWNTLSAADQKASEAAAKSEVAKQYPGYTGSSTCRGCHERFYELWAPSHHGLAMQPYTPKLGKEELTPQTEDIEIQGLKYRFVMRDDGAVVTETGPNKTKEYKVLHAMGGKNVYYFLTELDKGKLQVLPTAYDLRVSKWYDTAASALRHFSDVPDQVYHWTDYPYTFNTSCFGCHVSQLVNNYDLETGTYHTVWKEPGINCETCHGPAEKHLEIAAAHPDGKGVEDWGMPIILPKYGYTPEQANATCSNCHAKMSPLNADFKPGDEFFQHYDLVTYEHRDFYPDGRDLGENYTYTSWLQSECVRNSGLHCLKCHTSSGRYRFHGEEANNACMPCHDSKVKNIVVHSRHKPETGLTECIQCHMPKTSFGNMNRSDHSMRPPMPSATIKFGSPNACNMMCHQKESSEWADQLVREWHKDDYQAETLKLGTWIQQMRRQNYSDLKNILAYMQDKGRDEIFANSMIRMLGPCSAPEKIPALINILKNDASPLCRSSAADALNGLLAGPGVTNALIDATADTYRLVRMRAASVLTPLAIDDVPAAKRDQVNAAMKEYLTAMMARPDDATGYFNMGNYYVNKNNITKAIDNFETSTRLRPDFTPAYINVSMAYNRIGRNDKALAALDAALKYEPHAAAAHLNRALLLAEMGRYGESEKAFRATLKYDPRSAVAAYNLAILVSKSDPKETLQLIRKAYELEPNNDKYAYTAAFYAFQFGYVEEATGTLNKLVSQGTDYVDAYVFLADIYMRQGQMDQGLRIYQLAADNTNLPETVREQFRQQTNLIQQNGGQMPVTP